MNDLASQTCSTCIDPDLSFIVRELYFFFELVKTLFPRS